MTYKANAPYITEGYDPNDGLPRGRWMRSKWGVQVFVETGPPPIRERPKPDLSLLIACPQCQAKVNETCKTATGRSTDSHSRRLVQRLCPCGAPPRRNGTFCMECARESKRLSTRMSKQRSRAAKERAA